MPPKILDRDTSTDLVVRENSNVSLHCRAVGYPEPYVMWRREDGKDINYNGDVGKLSLYCAWEPLIFPMYVLL